MVIIIDIPHNFNINWFSTYNELRQIADGPTTTYTFIVLLFKKLYTLASIIDRPSGTV